MFVEIIIIAKLVIKLIIVIYFQLTLRLNFFNLQLHLLSNLKTY